MKIRKISASFWTAGVIFLAAAVMKVCANIPPRKIVIPVMPQPSPNARTYFDIAAGEVNKNLGDLVDASSAQAGTTLAQRNDPMSGWYSPAPKVIDQEVQQSIPAFHETEKGLMYTYVPLPTNCFTDTDNTQLSKYRNLVRCLRTSSDLEAAHGDWQTAAQYRLDCIDLGVHLTNGSPILGTLVGLACEAIGQRGFDDIIPHLTASQAKEAAARLTAIDSERMPISDAMVEEKYTMQRSLLDLFKTPNWRNKIYPIDREYDPSRQHSPQAFMTEFVVNTDSPQKVFDRYTRYMDRCAGYAALPWSLQIKLSAPMPDLDPISGQLEPVCTGITFNGLRATTFSHLDETQLALHAYYLKEKYFPQALSELVPGYLTAVPPDPFADGQPLIYRRLSPNRFLLYSVGPDGKDDGGTPSINPNAQTSNEPSVVKYRVLMSSQQGDIVAGVNY